MFCRLEPVGRYADPKTWTGSTESDLDFFAAIGESNAELQEALGNSSLQSRPCIMVNTIL